MTGLSQLPHDILYIVCSELERDLLSLCCLARVCRSFNQAARKLVFRHVGGVRQEKQHLLTRSFAEDPDLRSSVKSCRSFCVKYRGKIFDYGTEKALDFEKFPNLREITVQMTSFPVDISKRPVTWNFECDIFDTCSFAGVHTINLTGPSIAVLDPTDMVRFMSLPDVRNIVAAGCDDWVSPLLQPAFIEVKTALTSLDIRGRRDTVFWSVAPTSLWHILSCCPRLEHLRCHTPSYFAHLKSETGLHTMLEPIRESLKSLELFQDYQPRPTTSGEGVLMNFSWFPTLVELHIPSRYLFLSRNSFDRSEGLHKMLPRCLRRLRVEFQKVARAAIIGTGPGDVDQATLSQSWLLELPIEKPTSFPELKEVIMVDVPRPGGQSESLRPQWSPPDDIVETFSQAGIKLDVRLSYVR
ncbi:hypothetical protein BDV95DRAFT_139342 [Massariosphaeria phaeospora]|uniref:F-box domain-containing protein n=1 Tax=Massariosphaeria phaeospora TaxID=100035 RepID=A0A7C8MHR1_9PLEO|nr:hypothetical protein BDV95DRAFT_139342 [Massariosphaeria phaeospora]